MMSRIDPNIQIIQEEAENPSELPNIGRSNPIFVLP